MLQHLTPLVLHRHTVCSGCLSLRIEVVVRMACRSAVTADAEVARKRGDVRGRARQPIRECSPQEVGPQHAQIPNGKDRRRSRSSLVPDAARRLWWGNEPHCRYLINLRPAGALPLNRDFQAMVFDASAGKAVMFGGETASGRRTTGPTTRPPGPGANSAPPAPSPRPAASNPWSSTPRAAECSCSGALTVGVT